MKSITTVIALTACLAGCVVEPGSGTTDDTVPLELTRTLDAHRYLSFETSRTNAIRFGLTCDEADCRAGLMVEISGWLAEGGDGGVGDGGVGDGGLGDGGDAGTGDGSVGDLACIAADFELSMEIDGETVGQRGLLRACDSSHLLMGFGPFPSGTPITLRLHNRDDLSAAGLRSVTVKVIGVVADHGAIATNEVKGSCLDQPELLCDGACTDLETDARNCGTCGLACAEGDLCSSGACVSGDYICYEEGNPLRNILDPCPGRLACPPVGGFCRFGVCDDDAACGPGGACRDDGTCEAIDHGPCSSTSGCDPDDECRDGFCMPIA